MPHSWERPAVYERKATLQKKNQKAVKNKNCEQYARTLALRAELEGKLDLWRKQVLSVQSLSIR